MNLKALTCGILLCTTLSAPTLASERLQQIKQAGEVKVCIWPGYFAISYRNPRSGELEGIDIDMAGEFARHLGVNLRFVESSFGKLIDNMSNNQCDISMHGVGVRDSRKPYMEFSEPYLSSGIYAVATRNNELIRQWQDIDQSGNVAVVQKGTYMEPVANNYFKKARVAVVDSFKAREQEVESGRADVFMTDYPYGKRMTALTEWAVLFAPPQPLAPTSYAYAVPKGETAWLEEVNAFLREMKRSGKLAAAAEKHGLSEILVKQ
ncbi:substrate-binding periplasmic protein [Neptuniibacter halophilus]|uniref:substrate-binding periplasmic protein n=1 Tax=Neptuniibacter halophilus TaxID=651666 RepID=UPI00257261C9|nr:ABC transporter substrate-binding protein [Neptuniibacter halophilus]